MFQVHYLVAAAAGFSAGLVVAYVLSTAFVFKGRARYSAGVEFMGFLVTGLIGLALTQALMFAFVSGAGLPAELAKAPTAVLVFSFNFFSRRLLLFASPRSQ
jgi:putative flippase GtrA